MKRLLTKSQAVALGSHLEAPQSNVEVEAMALSNFLLNTISLLVSGMLSWSELASSDILAHDLLPVIEGLASAEVEGGVGASMLENLYTIATYLIEERSVFAYENG